MKITVCSYSWGEHLKISAITFPRWQTYCDAHGYKFITDWPEPEDKESWPKPAMISKHLPGTDILMWVDCDALPTNPLRKIEDVWVDYGNRMPIVLSADVYGVNFGVAMLSDCPVVEEFLHAVSTVGYSLYKGNPWDEQEAVIRFSNAPPYKEHVKVVPQFVMNSYVNQEYGNRPTHWSGNWKPGDWIVHFPGLPLERRVELANEYGKKADEYVAEQARLTQQPPVAQTG